MRCALQLVLSACSVQIAGHVLSAAPRKADSVTMQIVNAIEGEIEHIYLVRHTFLLTKTSSVFVKLIFCFICGPSLYMRRLRATLGSCSSDSQTMVQTAEHLSEKEREVIQAETLSELVCDLGRLGSWPTHQ